MNKYDNIVEDVDFCKCKEVADILIYRALKNTMYANWTYDKNDLSEFNLTDKEIKEIIHNIANRNKDVLDIDFYGDDNNFEIDLTLSMTRSFCCHDSEEEEVEYSILQREALAKKFEQSIHDIVYDGNNKTVSFSINNERKITLQNVYSEEHGKALIEEYKLDLIDEDINTEEEEEEEME